MPDATPPKKAVALSYEGSGAPKVIARGTGELAKKSLKLLKQRASLFKRMKLW